MAKPSAAGTNQVFDAVSLELLWRRTISAVDEGGQGAAADLVLNARQRVRTTSPAF